MSCPDLWVLYIFIYICVGICICIYIKALLILINVIIIALTKLAYFKKLQNLIPNIEFGFFQN